VRFNLQAQKDHMLHTIFSDVAVSHLFNTLDCPLDANVIWWCFRGCAGEKRETEMCRSFRCDKDIYLSFLVHFHYFFFCFVFNCSDPCIPVT